MAPPANLARVFAAHDADGGGSMDARELRPALVELGVHLSAKEAAQTLAQADADNSGCLSLWEFAAIFEEGRLLCVFNEIDDDASGSISVDELGIALRKLGYSAGAGDVRRMLKSVDTSNDGSVDYAEFRDFFRFVPLASLETIAARWSSLGPVDAGSDLSPPVPDPSVPLIFGAYGGLGACLSRTATAPLEKVKIVAQTKGSVSITSELSKTWREAGARGLFAGNGANCLRVFPFAGIVTIVYLNALKWTPADAEFDAMEPFYRASCAATAGIVGQLATYPLDTIRARLTVDRSAYSGVADCARSIIRQGGSKALFKGVNPTILAVGPFVAAQLAMADAVKSLMSERGIEVTTARMMAVGALAGATGQSVVYPLDVIRRRLQVQAGDATWSTIVRQLGVRGLYAGIVPSFAKVMPACAVSMTATKTLIGMHKQREAESR